jgi:hypothetical protein
MILIDNIGQLMKQAETNNLRISDRSGMKWIMDINEASPENAFTKLKSYSEILSGYQVLTIKGGDDKTMEGHYTHGAEWKVYFPVGQTSISGGPAAAPGGGGYGKDYIALAVSLEQMKLQMSFDKKERDLEKKFGSSDEEKYLKYAPLFGPLLGIKDEDMFKRLQMCALAGNLSGLSGMMNNSAGGNKLSVEGTDAEKEKMVEKLVPEVFAKVDKTKFIQVLEAVKNNPDFLNQAHSFVSMQQPAAMAGPPAEAERIEYMPVDFVPGNNEDENF